MSLGHRVSTLEEYTDQWSERGSIHRPQSLNGSPVGSRAASPHRKLSFAPAHFEPPPDTEDTVAAFEVPKPWRILQVAVAVVYCLFAAGIVFGYAALKPVLIAENVYRELCTEKELEMDVRVCYKQEMRLNLMFTIAAVGTNVCALPVGTVLDRFGPRVSGLVGSFFITLGSLLFGLANRFGFKGYIPGYFFLALGGPFVFISSFQLSNTFPRHSGLILALLTGAFDTSSAIFLIYRLIYQATNGWFTPDKFFLIYLIVPVFIFIAQWTIMPSTSYKTVGELIVQAEESAVDEIDDGNVSSDNEGTALLREDRVRRESVVSEITELLGSKNAEETAAKEEQTRQNSGVFGALHGRTASQQLRSWWFVLITLFTVVQMLRINYFVATIRSQYEYLLGGPDDAEKVNTFFDVALPLGGVVAVPFIGTVLDNTSTPFVLAALVSVATAIGIFGCIPTTWAAYVNVILFVLYRPFYYTAVSDYAAKVFGFATFGKVYGLIICLAGLCNFLQSALDALTHSAFDSDPIPINLVLLFVALLVGIVLVGFVWRRSRSIDRERLEERAEDAREVSVPCGFESVTGDVEPGDRYDHRDQNQNYGGVAGS